MKKAKLIVISGVLCASGLLSNAATAGIDRATVLSNTCLPCHGQNGNSEGAIPSIAGTNEQKIIDTMNAFASGEKPSTVMQRIAKGYSQEDIKALAGYFSKQEYISK